MLNSDQTEQIGKFVQPGSILPPGPIGRLVRLGLGVICLDLVLQIVDDISGMIERGWPVNFASVCSVFLGFYLLRPVIAIGFTKQLKYWPQMIIAVFTLVLCTYQYFENGNFTGPIFTAFLMFWMTYVYGHLGISFVVAALLKTPGCEMRAIPHLWSKVSNSKYLEHFCPGPLSPLDKWERKMFSKAE